MFNFFQASVLPHLPFLFSVLLSCVCQNLSCIWHLESSFLSLTHSVQLSIKHMTSTNTLKYILPTHADTKRYSTRQSKQTDTITVMHIKRHECASCKHSHTHSNALFKIRLESDKTAHIATRQVPTRLSCLHGVCAFQRDQVCVSRLTQVCVPPSLLFCFKGSKLIGVTL